MVDTGCSRSETSNRAGSGRPDRWLRLLPLILAGVLAATDTGAAARQPTAPPTEKVPLRAPESFEVETSDGWHIPLWFYTPAETHKRPPAIILLHDLGGSHESVKLLAQALQAAGCAVAVPDLRGHGRSKAPTAAASEPDKSGRRDRERWELLKRPDFEMMAASGGGQKRDQALVRGDVESVRNWLKQRAETGGCDFSRLVVVGSGVGATVAAVWTAHDWAWPDLPAEQQGRQVRGLVLISPAAPKHGFAIPDHNSEAVRREVPLMLIAGRKDDEALRLFKALKKDKDRARSWFEQRAGAQKPTRAPDLDKDAVATLYLLQFDSVSEGDTLASFRAADGGQAVDPATLIQGFVSTLPPASR